jgi:hypothetical protein
VSALFRRGSRRGDSPEPDELLESDAENVDDADETDELEEDDPGAGLSPRPDGPWDSTERPDVEGLVDLGALRLKGRDGMELRLEVEESSGRGRSAAS